ncbi:MAG: aminopeptidase P family protein, partial [Gemmatimonadetes bacterium]|nr:aminopeptidase P family protein [Gemmatimonadota bacterium]
LHVGGENAGGTAIFLFLRSPAGLRSLAVSPSGEATALRDVGVVDSVVSIERGVDVYARATEELRRGGPARIAVNSSTTRAAADGLSHTQRLALEKALGPELTARLVSADELVTEWLSVKLPEEVEILRRAAELTAKLELEAYEHVIPGKTRDSDVARHLKRRMAELGVEDAWAPQQNPNVNSGPDRGHSHATDRVIQRGDIVQTDFGIKVWGIWCTDIQRFAYVLREGESEPPAEAVRRWENGRNGGRAAFEAMRPGVRGYDVDKAQRDWMASVGSLPVPWSTGHPVGYWAHDVGPSLGGAQRAAPPSGDALRRLGPGHVFAFDGFFSWAWAGESEAPGEATKTISVEEMAVVTPAGAEYLIPPQQDLVAIP